MTVPPSVRLRWLGYKSCSLRLLNAIEALSDGDLTEPMSLSDLGRRAGVFHRQTLAEAMKEIAGEVVRYPESPRKVRFGLVSLREERSESERYSRSDAKTERPERSESEPTSLNEVMHNIVQKMNAPVSSASGPKEADVQKMHDDPNNVHKVDATSGERAENAQSTPDLVGVVFNTTDKGESSTDNPGGVRDNPDEPPAPVDVAPDLVVILAMPGTQIDRLIQRGDFPRERLKELAEAEVALRPTGKPRMSYVKKWLARHYAAPQAEVQPMFGAICGAFGWEPKQLTDPECAKVNIVASQLVKAGRKPEQIPRIYAYCAAKDWPGGFTPMALVNHASAALAAPHLNGRAKSEPRHAALTSDERAAMYTGGKFADIIES